MRFIASTLCICLLLLAISGNAQIHLEQTFAELQKGTELPEQLQSSRTIIILKIDPSTPLGADKNNEILTRQFHTKLVEMHIDAVAYFRWQDLIAGFDATRSYIEAIKDREISQIIFLSAENNRYELLVVATSEESELLDTNRPVWHSTSNTLEAVLENLASAVRRTDLEIANFLIADSPEIFVDTQIFRKNRFELFQPDLKLDKLAAPLFNGNDPDNIENPDDQNLKSTLDAQYPFSFEVVSNEMTEDLMRKAGFHYVLRYLFAEESTLLTLLDYNDAPSDPQKFGYKFYVKHLISGDIYLGNIWDSRSTWQSALNIHLSNMKKTLKVE